MLEEVLSLPTDCIVDAASFQDRTMSYPLALGAGAHVLAMNSRLRNAGVYAGADTTCLYVGGVPVPYRKNWSAFVSEYVKYVRKCVKWALDHPVDAFSFSTGAIGVLRNKCSTCASAVQCSEVCTAQRQAAERLWLSQIALEFSTFSAEAANTLYGRGRVADIRLTRTLIPSVYWTVPRFLPATPVQVSEEDAKGDRWQLSA